MQSIHPDVKYKAAMDCYDILLFVSYHRYNIQPILSDKMALFLAFIKWGNYDLVYWAWSMYHADAR